ncbi:fused FliR family export protein/FlhB family type III secretion system protein [Clostridium autoethanogenum]|uniref:Flagellar biosynthetic protein FliR n=2 Tax=Clostridium autoethanogenum TaxID=84023 RepID=A0A3M0T215_9CLOT|nr:fused FliR family export protein/FlhB family type III secretion system protein [Clostridium autoethanogenum]AGY77329.1 fused FliR family export protein/FlhB family type III secretion system protein [Clostridium autoethanogenum DSM 10061]ALU37471.1 Flagellar biosynthetic protein fliR/flhB [Clostridium autoethanogenum DSM 10061]OVY49118.1 Flagellar biosynthetic protein FlhB [Clostridium autoethanogenum]RMD04285.1 fused FliR family export protein/FlhB family type III secretion system protein [C
MINTLYFTALILVSIRIFSFFILVPIFFPSGIPNVVKVGLTVVMAYILMPGIDYSSISSIDNTMFFVMNCLNEVAAGLTLGFLTSLCFSMVRIAGNLMDMQMGFAMVSMFDPTSNSNTTLIERLLYWFSLVIFFIVDGHHMLIKSLIQSFSVIKLGSFFLNQASINIIFKAFIEYFGIAIQIGIPIVLILLFTDLTMSLIARTVPQLNIMILGLPVKVLIGFASFCFALPIFLKLIEHLFTAIPNSIDGFYKALPLLLIFAKDDKTEEATPKKKSDSRKKGQIARSKEIGLTMTLLASTLVIAVLGGYVGTSLGSTMVAFLNDYINTSLNYSSVNKIMFITIWRIAIVFLPIAVPILAIGVLANMVQTRGLITFETLKPDFSKLNPISGFKRMFSARSVMELLKDTAIVSIVGYVGYKFIKDNYMYILNLGQLDSRAVAKAIGSLAVGIFFRITLIMLIIAILDYMFQRYQYNKDLRMSKQEIKEEFKQDEGDPQIKGKRRQKQRELAMRRMMQEVPKATVVVTNPTHVAVALKYEDGQNAPVLVAKGLDAVALKIKEIAKDNDVPIIENRPLARLIYKEVEIDMEIPAEMYQAVAEILALVYKMR